MTPRHGSADLAERLLHAGLPWLTPDARALLRRLIDRAPAAVTAAEACRWAGVADRHGLRRFLAHAGLPSFRELTAWVRVFVLVLEWERAGTTLSRAAQAAGRTPGGYTRAVQRATGLPWLEVRARGSTWVLVHLLALFRPPADPVVQVATG